MAVVKDWRGTVIKVGSTVVYPSRQSSALWMNEGVVVSVELGTSSWRGNDVYKVGVRRTNTTGYGEKIGARVSYPDYSRITVIA